MNVANIIETLKLIINALKSEAAHAVNAMSNNAAGAYLRRIHWLFRAAILLPIAVTGLALAMKWTSPRAIEVLIALVVLSGIIGGIIIHQKCLLTSLGALVGGLILVGHRYVPWQWVVGWAGVFCLLMTLFLWLYSIPLGALIDMLLVKRRGPKEEKEGEGKEGPRLGAKRLEGHTKILQQVMIYEAAIFFTAYIIPFHTRKFLIPGFIMMVIFLIVTAFAWNTKTGEWLKPWVRSGCGIALGGFLFIIVTSAFLPNVEWFKFGQMVAHGTTVLPSDAAPTLKDVTATNLFQMAKLTTEKSGGAAVSSATWVEANYQKPSFWVMAGLVLLLAAIVGKSFGWVKEKVQGTDAEEHGEHKESGGGHHHGLSPVQIASLIVIVGFGVVWGVTKVMAYNDQHMVAVRADLAAVAARDAAKAVKDTAEAATKKIQEVPNIKALLQSTNFSAMDTLKKLVPTIGPRDEEWGGYTDLTKYAALLTSTNDFKVKRPWGYSVGVRPRGLQTEMRYITTTGTTNLWVAGEKIPPQAESVLIRLKDRTAETATIGVGRLTTRPLNRPRS